MANGNGDNKHFGKGSQGKGDGAGAMTELDKDLVGDNDILSSREKQQHSKERGQDGNAHALTNGLAIDAPSLAGDTGILEAGLTLKPSDALPLSIDLGLQGFVGQREGVAGSFQARLAF